VELEYFFSIFAEVILFQTSLLIFNIDLKLVYYKTLQNSKPGGLSVIFPFRSQYEL
jgi:hypothetical protein